MNSIQLIGRLVKAPELRYTATGKAVATFNLAVNRTFSKGNEADFFNIVIWQKTAENCANYLDKGSKVAVLGRLQTRNYENKEGQKVYVTEIVANEVEFLDSKKDSKPAEEKEEKEADTPDVDFDQFSVLDNEDIPF